LPFLNELGVDKISFIYCERSQKSYKLNLEKLNKILINSSSQCGRSNIIKLEIIDSLNNFLQSNNNVIMINFSENKFEILDNCIYLVGCEGGFSKEEIKLFSNKKTMGLDSNLILKSETAITAISSKALL
jgi:16S rRNA (uracil1498-N3)-methyltransferase